MTGEYARLWGGNIRSVRLAQGKTQDQLAESVGVTAATVSRWESGKATPRDDHKVAIATALGVDARVLFPLVRNGS